MECEKKRPVELCQWLHIEGHISHMFFSGINEKSSFSAGIKNENATASPCQCICNESKSTMLTKRISGEYDINSLLLISIHLDTSDTPEIHSLQ